jgi:four helix bundle protein
MSNNIAAGPGSNAEKNFNQFLNLAHKSTFESANILILLGKRGLLSKENLGRPLERLEIICRQIIILQKVWNKGFDSLLAARVG